MKLEIRAELLKAAIHDDHEEVRSLKDRIYQIATLLTAASFAVTAFFLRQSDWKGPKVFLVITDCAFLALLWASIWPLKQNLDFTRNSLEAREELIPKLETAEDIPFTPYVQIPPGKKPRIRENGVLWVLALASCALLAKAIAVICLIM